MVESFRKRSIPFRVVESKTKGEKHDAFDHLQGCHRYDDGLDVTEEYYATGGEGSESFILRRVSEVDMQHVSWLIPGYIPRGMLTLAEGEPEFGKTTLLLEVAARLTRGEPMPGETDADLEPDRKAGNVLIVTNEDTIATGCSSDPSRKKTTARKKSANCNNFVDFTDYSKYSTKIGLLWGRM